MERRKGADTMIKLFGPKDVSGPGKDVSKDALIELVENIWSDGEMNIGIGIRKTGLCYPKYGRMMSL